MKKSAIFCTCYLTITTALFGVSGYILNKDKEYFDQKQKQCEDLNHLLLTTNNGIPITTDLTDPIGIVMNNVSEDNKKEIIKSINEMNEICNNLDYTIINNDNLKIKNKIYISTDYNLDDTYFDHALGYTELTYNQHYGKITFPLNIYIDSKVNGVTDENGVTLLSYVLKHELMHTLGFRDLYDEEYLNKTIMYYNIDGDINNLTEFDKTNLKKLYDEENVIIKYPKTLNVINNTPKKEDDFCL